MKSFLPSISHLIFNIYFQIIIIITIIFILSIYLLNKLLRNRKTINLKKYFNESIELENFLTLFASNLRFGLSPELSLLKSCNSYSGTLKNKIKQLKNYISSGLNVFQVLSILSKELYFDENKRVIYLFMKMLNKAPRKLGHVAYDVINNIKELRELRFEIDTMFSRMKLRVILLSIISSIVYAFMVKISYFFLFQTTIFSKIKINLENFHVSLFIATALLTFINSYYISLAIGISRPVIISIISELLYLLAYLVIPRIPSI